MAAQAEGDDCPEQAWPAGKFVAFRVAPAVEAPPACSRTFVLALGMRLEMTELALPDYPAQIRVRKMAVDANS